VIASSLLPASLTHSVSEGFAPLAFRYCDISVPAMVMRAGNDPHRRAGQARRLPTTSSGQTRITAALPPDAAIHRPVALVQAPNGPVDNTEVASGSGLETNALWR
jgi:hypothetical protein